MKTKHTIESQLHCKATAELADSIIDDMLKSDGSLKDLINENSEHNNESNNSDRSTIKESRK